MIVYPKFSPLFGAALAITLPIGVCAFILYFLIVEGVTLFDMLQAWQIFISPSLFPSCILSAVLVAFVLAYIARLLLSCELKEQGLLLYVNRRCWLQWQDIQTLALHKCLMVDVVYIRLHSGKRYYLPSSLWYMGLIDADGHIKINEVGLILERMIKTRPGFNKHF